MKEFCTKEVYINGEKKMSSIMSSAYEVDLSFLKMGDPVIVKIIHTADCKPKVLNPQVIRNDRNEFHFVSFTVSNDKINWSTKGEAGGSKLFIQQFTRGQWINVKEKRAKRFANAERVY